MIHPGEGILVIGGRELAARKRIVISVIFSSVLNLLAELLPERGGDRLVLESGLGTPPEAARAMAVDAAIAHVERGACDSGPLLARHLHGRRVFHLRKPSLRSIRRDR